MVSFVRVCGHRGNPEYLMGPCSQHLSWVKPALPAPCRTTAGVPGLWGAICPPLIWGCCAHLVQQAARGHMVLLRAQPCAHRCVLSQLSCRIPTGLSTELQSQAELLLRDQRCDSPCWSPKLCCSSRALLLPRGGFPNPTAATPARTWQCWLRGQSKIQE